MFIIQFKKKTQNKKQTPKKLCVSLLVSICAAGVDLSGGVMQTKTFFFKFVGLFTYLCKHLTEQTHSYLIENLSSQNKQLVKNHTVNRG